MTSCDTNGLVAENGNAVETLDAEVKGRVPQAYLDGVDALVAERKLQYPRYSRGDLIRDALAVYFEKYLPTESAGKETAA